MTFCFVDPFLDLVLILLLFALSVELETVIGCGLELLFDPSLEGEGATDVIL